MVLATEMKAHFSFLREFSKVTTHLSNELQDSASSLEGLADPGNGPMQFRRRRHALMTDADNKIMFMKASTAP